MKTRMISLAMLTVLLAACDPTTSSKEAVKPQQKNEPKVEQKAEFVPGGYEKYTDGVVGNGTPVVLFFHAEWCSYCKEKHENLSMWYSEAEFPVMTYQVDFDTNTALKSRYGVTSQDTFILVDGDGEEVKAEINPSLSALKRLLYMNVGTAKAMEDDAMMKDEEEENAMADSDDHGGWVDEADASGRFTSYIDGVVGNGMESVLFFHAEWCPYCKTNEARLKGWYAAEDFSRSTYKIDFDTATELRSEFGVTQQDTFILIDGNGNEVKRVSFPSEEALRALLG